MYWIKYFILHHFKKKKKIDVKRKNISVLENVQESTCLNGKNSADTVAMNEKTPVY